MKVVIAGGHGKIAMHVERLLAERGDHSVALIRNPDQEADVIAAGGHPVVVDLESTTAADLSIHLTGADAVVFAAGAGPESTAERKDSVDRAAAALLADAAELAGVRRYLLVSAIGSDAGAQPDHDPIFAAYMSAKQAADEDLRTRNLDWTVLRPGALTDGSGSGHVTLSQRVGRGSIPREDVAAVLVALLDAPETSGLSLDVVSGRHLIADAVAEATVQPPETQDLNIRTTVATTTGVDRAGLLEFVAGRHHMIVTTWRADGGPQSSPVAGGVDDQGRIVVATYPERAKVHNARREPRASVLVLSDDFGGPWVQIDGTAEVLDLPDAMEPLVQYFRSIAGEHPDWDEYRHAMTVQGKCLLRVSPTRWSPIATGGFPARLA